MRLHSFLVPFLVLLLPAQITEASTWDTMKLHRAAQKEDPTKLRELLAEGRDPNATISGGRTPMFFAATKGRVEAAKVLQEAGANPDHVAEDGRTPLMLASSLGRDEMVQWLLDQGANVNSITRNGWTALMRAAQNGHAESVRLLLAKGAWTTPTNSEGHDAFLLARGRKVSNLLNEVGRRGNERAESTPASMPGGQQSPKTEKRIPVATSEPGVTMSFRQGCPGPLGQMYFMAGDNVFFVDVELESDQSLREYQAFEELAERLIDTVKKSCQDGHLLPTITIALTTEEYPHPEQPAAFARYRQGIHVQIESKKGESLELQNYLLAKQIWSDFKAKHGVSEIPRLAEVIANPFLFQDKTVGLILKFGTMETPDMGRFYGPSGEVLISGIPSGLFRLPNKLTLIAGQVTGKGAVPGTEPRLPMLRFVGNYTCHYETCSDLRLSP